MTYGEAVMAQKATMRMQNGVWVSDPLPAHVRLNEKEALEYYGQKLDKYWASQIVPSVIKRLGEERALAALKGRL